MPKQYTIAKLIDALAIALDAYHELEDRAVSPIDQQNWKLDRYNIEAAITYAKGQLEQENN